MGLQLAFERTESTGGSYEAAGARRSYYARRRCSGARSSPAMADGGFERSRGSGYRAHAREREVRGKEEGLTADSQSRPVCSGTSCVRRIDGDGDLRRPEVMKATATFQGVRRLVA